MTMAGPKPSMHELMEAMPESQEDKDALDTLFGDDEVDDEEEVEPEPKAPDETAPATGDEEEDEDEDDSSDETDDSEEGGEGSEAEDEDLDEEELSYKHRNARNRQKWEAERQQWATERAQLQEQMAALGQQTAHLTGFQQAQVAQQQQASQAPVQIAPEQIAEAVSQAPIETFNWALANRPDLLPTVISQTREAFRESEKPELRGLADQMHVSYSQALAQQAHQASQAQLQEARAPELMRQGMQHLLGEVSASVGHETFDAIAPRVNELMYENWGEVKQRGDFSPGAVKDFLQKQTLIALSETASSQGTQPKKARRIPVEDHVEGSNAGSAPSKRGKAPVNEEPGMVEELADTFAKNQYR